jgi:hypothetical protein
MNTKFDEPAKGLAQSVTRRQAFKKFGVGFAGMVLACFGVANKAEADKVCLPGGHACSNDLPPCCNSYHCKPVSSAGSYCVSKYPIG